jgi:hypothetical protein
MRMPWSKQTEDSQPTVAKSTAALSGAAGDGLEHDLQYWVDSGFLTLPQDAIDAHAARLAPPPSAQDQPG